MARTNRAFLLFTALATAAAIGLAFIMIDRARLTRSMNDAGRAVAYGCGFNNALRIEPQTFCADERTNAARHGFHEGKPRP